MRQLAVLLPLVAACADQGAILAEKERLALRVSELEAENKRLDRENDRLHAEVRRLKDATAAADRASAAAEAKEKLALKPGQAITARLQTSKGTIRCTLWPETAPIAVLNFVELAEGRRTWTDPDEGGETTRPLYNGTIFHRIIPRFMIQGGDPMGTGEGGPGYTFADETSPDVVFDRPGLLAMANAGPDTNGSQFFITDRATPRHLDGKHTIFGVCQDLDVVEAIATAERDRDDRPREPIVLQKVTIERK